MNENVAHVARRCLITTVWSYDPTVVSKKAVEDSTEFVAFLQKNILDNNLEGIDVASILSDLEDSLNVKISDNALVLWKDLFELLISLLKAK